MGLDPRSLLEETEEPRFIWRDEARFKNLTTETTLERAVIASFGMSVGRLLLEAAPEAVPVEGIRAGELRKSILASQPFVRLIDLLALCWGVGIPVIHTRVFPLKAKRFQAMVVRVKRRHAIILGKEATYPPWLAFYLAHELGHIALGHVVEGAMLVDLEIEDSLLRGDEQEVACDRFALELLTGTSEPVVLSTARRVFAKQLATHAKRVAERLHIEPGTLCLSFGHTSNSWATANGALKHLYGPPRPIWRDINRVALGQLKLDRTNEDARAFLAAVLGT